MPVWQSWVRKARSDAFAAGRVRDEFYRPAEELYDVVSDPHELKNLAGDLAHRELLLVLRQKVKDWMKQQGDAGDSAYHRDVESGRNYLDEVDHRHQVGKNDLCLPFGSLGKAGVRLFSKKGGRGR